MAQDPQDSDLTTTESPAVRRISVADARALVSAGRAVLVDARSRHLYDNAHVRGAISFPLAEIEAAPGRVQLDTVPPGGIIILYCA